MRPAGATVLWNVLVATACAVVDTVLVAPSVRFWKIGRRHQGEFVGSRELVFNAIGDLFLFVPDGSLRPFGVLHSECGSCKKQSKGGRFHFDKRYFLVGCV